MVEMALITPLLVVLVMGIIDAGYYVYTYSELENATRRASEWAYKSPPTTPEPADDQSSDKCGLLIEQAALQHVFLSALTLDNIETRYPDLPEREVGVPIEVRITYTGNWLTPIGRRLLAQALTFDFTSRRTIVNTSPPAGLNADCA